jgi:hypothetical protein
MARIAPLAVVVVVVVAALVVVESVMAGLLRSLQVASTD